MSLSSDPALVVNEAVLTEVGVRVLIHRHEADVSGVPRWTLHADGSRGVRVTCPEDELLGWVRRFAAAHRARMHALDQAEEEYRRRLDAIGVTE